MSGNVWEWTDSWWDRREKAWVLRGGSWARGQKEARLYTREQNMPHYAYADIGFRVALTTLP
jgi:formylglycine-generating enzyme required for sulfatase activity